MSKGPLLTAIVAIASFGIVVAAFMNNASPYVESIAAAKQSGDDRLHLAGDLVKGSVRQDLESGKVRFRLRDSHGEVIEVFHKGDPPANMGDATQVVAIGGIKGDHFESSKLLIKCPSKYEGEEKQGAVART